MTNVLRLAGDPTDDAIYDRAAESLAAGRLVAFPTETVYGLGANAALPNAIEKLDFAKQRPHGKPYSFLLGDRGGMAELAAYVPVLARKLLDQYWPGPLTVVFPAKGGGTVGLRLPACEHAREIIRRAGVPVAVTSANPADKPAPTTADHVLAYFDGMIDLIVDGGATRLRESSAVIQFADGRWDVLRSGVIDHDTVAKAAKATILFVCTGNSCRSPMAAVLCKKHLAERMDAEPDDLRELGYRILSAGTNAASHQPATHEGVIVMRERGCDLSGHLSRQLDADLIEEAAEIFVMSTAHREAILREAPGAADRVRMLTRDELGIADPIGGDVERFARCADQIEDAVKELVKTI